MIDVMASPTVDTVFPNGTIPNNALRNAAPALIAAAKERDELRAQRDVALNMLRERPTTPHPVDALNNLTKGLLEHAEEECENLRALLAKAEEALGPFAAIICRVSDEDESKGYAFDIYPDNQHVFAVGRDRIITAGNLRAARAVLAEIKATLAAEPRPREDAP